MAPGAEFRNGSKWAFQPGTAWLKSAGIIVPNVGPSASSPRRTSDRGLSRTAIRGRPPGPEDIKYPLIKRVPVGLLIVAPEFIPGLPGPCQTKPQSRRDD